MEKLKAGAARLGLELNGSQIGQFQLYYEELVNWNQRMNLTAITGYEEAQVKHFLDSLSVSLALRKYGELKRDVRLMDVGSGAGLPGIPLKIAFPQLRLTLLESVGKKTAFLREVVQRLGMEAVEVITGRAEEVAHNPAYRESFDVVTARAVASLAALAELTLPFCKPGGSSIAQKQGDIGQELERSQKAIQLMGGKFQEIIPVDLEGLEGRLLVVVAKATPTPERYPRRPGMPAKRPIL